jgi:predicted Zn-dependent peptidase
LLCAEPVSAVELENAKERVKGAFVIGQETTAAQGSLLGIYELLGLGYDFPDEFLRLMKR